jgi:hypothetical protein
MKRIIEGGKWPLFVPSLETSANVICIGRKLYLRAKSTRSFSEMLAKMSRGFKAKNPNLAIEGSRMPLECNESYDYSWLIY